ncbi:MAG: hypothetical protein AAAC48_29355, partial [Phyllobacterium sp.]
SRLQGATLTDPDVSVSTHPAPTVQPVPDTATANVQTALAPDANQNGDIIRQSARTAKALLLLILFSYPYSRPAGLAFSPLSEDNVLAQWFQKRTEDGRGGTRKTMIVALARRLLIALWRMATKGEIRKASHCGRMRSK